MNVMDNARDFVSGLPEALQGFGVFLVSFIPWVEGEGAALIGVLVGVGPWLAIPAAAVGNVLIVAALVHVAGGTRAAVLRRRGRARADGTAAGVAASPADVAPPAADARMRERFERWGVPGVSMIGPWLFLPGHVAGPAMVGLGATKGYVMAWQAVSIVVYTGFTGLLAYGLLSWATRAGAEAGALMPAGL